MQTRPRSLAIEAASELLPLLGGPRTTMRCSAAGCGGRCRDSGTQSAMNASRAAAVLHIYTCGP